MDLVSVKNVIIITYYFPPDSEIGAIRPYGFAKYLPLFGWNPIILTTSSDNSINSNLNISNLSIFYTQKSDIVKSLLKILGFSNFVNFENCINIHKSMHINLILLWFLKIIGSIICYPDPQKNWLNSATAMANNICIQYKIDAVVSTSVPETCHIVANRLVRTHNLPWVADFRDLWTQTHAYPYFHFRKYFERRLEIKTLLATDAITTVSRPLADKLSLFHKKKPIFSILNGFDPDQINPGTPVDPKFRIIYTGKIYQGNQDPTPLFLAISSLCHEGKLDRKKVQIDFYGYHENRLQTDVEKHNLQDIVTLHGQVSREIATAEQRKAQILLLLAWNDPAESGVYTGKLFDYLAACRPILSIGSTDGGVVNELLNQTQGGAHISDVEELKKYLNRMYLDYIKNGIVQYQGINAEIMKYSHKEMARKLAEVLDEIWVIGSSTQKSEMQLQKISDSHLIMKKTADNFGFEWAQFNQLKSEKGFLEFISPIDTEFFKGKLVLDAGCGNGSYSYYSATYGAEVIAIDFSDAVYVARENTKTVNVQVIRADINHLPFKQGTFDYVFSIGVLHHLPEPETGFCQLVPLLKPGALISIWVYGRAKQWAAIYIYNPIIKITPYMPHRLLYYLCYIPAMIMEINNCIYRFLLWIHLPKFANLFPFKYYAEYPFSVKLNDAFDTFATPLARYYTDDELYSWYQKKELKNIFITDEGVAKGLKGFGYK